MKVGILTFHNAYNYGAVLQTYATQELVKGFGHQVEVIDYHNHHIDYSYERRRFHLREFLDSRRNFPFYLIEKIFFWKRKRAYRLFFNNHIVLSKKRYDQEDDVMLDGYDVLLIGSDQLWNKKLTDGLDKVYWGQAHVLSNTKIISWSVCMNNIELNENEISQIRKYLKSFASISVREDSLRLFIQNLTEKKVWHTLDPTLMLPRSKWDKLCQTVKETNYIAVYAIRNEEETVAFAKKIANKLNKRIVIIRSYAKWYLSRENKECLGPGGFLSYIKNADFVVTSSFHGTVFSILLQRQFVCPKFEGNIRIEDLLRTVGLSNRMITEWYEVLNLQPIDYNNLSSCFEVKKNETMCFLRDALKNRT